MQYSPTSRFALWLVGLGGGRGGCLTGAFPFFLAWGASLLLWLVVVEAARAFFGGSGAFLDLGLDLGSGGAWDAVISGQWSEVFSMDKKVNRSQLTQTDNTNIQQQARQQLLFAAWALGNQERLLHLFSLTELLLQKKKKKGYHLSQFKAFSLKPSARYFYQSYLFQTSKDSHQYSQLNCRLQTKQDKCHLLENSLRFFSSSLRSIGYKTQIHVNVNKAVLSATGSNMAVQAEISPWSNTFSYAAACSFTETAPLFWVSSSGYFYSLTKLNRMSFGMGMLFPPASPLGIHIRLQFQESTVTQQKSGLYPHFKVQ